ncbi:nucleotidyl transferase AbiEii/AbiGii toxin family protein [Candidatus Falkowbacteria bacterium]|nr:nucleotidyl transferase AbiEii/AbiGii toxin family protein [Candidatus Falkowbacteria bacterium]
MQFGHRISVDFDFFTPTQFKSAEIVDRLNKIGKFVFQEAAEKNTLLGLFENVKFSLFLYKYPLIFKPIEYLGVYLADPKDIAAMKLAAIMDRGTKKDFIDLFFLNKNGVSIEQAFGHYDKKYKSLANNIYSLVKSLSYFEDAEKLEMPEMIEKINWEEVKEFFRKEVLKLADKYL